MAKGPKKYFNDGTEHTGGTQKMLEGSSLSSTRHTKTSWPEASFNNLSDRAQKKALSNKYYK